MDLQMFSQMCQKLPGITVTNEVVEPSADMLFKYKGKQTDKDILSYSYFILFCHMGASAFCSSLLPCLCYFSNGPLITRNIYISLLILYQICSCCFSVLVSKTPNLDHINFIWNKMTASEFENHWKEKNLDKKFDFIHMIQV